MEKAKIAGVLNSCKERLQNTVLGIGRYSIKLEYKFEKIHGKKAVAINVRKICSDETLKEIFNEYDDSQIKISSRAVNWLIKEKKYFCLSILMKIKNTIGL